MLHKNSLIGTHFNPDLHERPGIFYAFCFFSAGENFKKDFFGLRKSL